MYTELDIINSMVATTGTRPFVAAPTQRHPTYSKAEQLLTDITLAVHSLGLWYNTEVRTIQQQVNGEIIVPTGCIKADPINRRCNLTLRAGKMYDLDTGTFEIGEDTELKMFFALDLDDTPLEAKVYIRARAMYEFYLDANGTDPKLSNYRSNRDMAFTRLWREHLRNRQTNIFDNNANTVAKLRRGNRFGNYRPIVR